ncbi:AAA family ATPase [Candidatus Uhrbacteria bacterium]|nr:AAA family ATPase [Candidatus Uhrbacteria bacterium]
MISFFIGLVGPSGSGKSTLADAIEKEGVAKRFRMDAYYKSFEACPKTPDGRANYDVPESLDLERLYKDLCALKRGETITMPVYDRAQERPVGTELFSPVPVLLIEGLFLYNEPRIRDLIDLRLWIEAPEALIKSRRADRQGSTFDEAYYTHVVCEGQRRYVEPMRRFAKVVLDGSEPTEVVAARAKEAIEKWYNR